MAARIRVGPIVLRRFDRQITPIGELDCWLVASDCRHPPCNMNPSKVSIIAAILLSGIAFADPMLRLETTLAAVNGRGEKEILSRPTVLVESGKEARVQMGERTYVLSPKWPGKGAVEIEVVVMEAVGGVETTLGKPRVVVAPGQVAEVRISGQSFTIQPWIEG